MSLIFHMYEVGMDEAIAQLWNESLFDTHGFFPITAEFFHQNVIEKSRFRPEFFLIASDGGKYVGMIHFDIVEEDPYEKAGVISMLLVHPSCRCEEYGEKLLKEAIHKLERNGVKLIDAGGAWPYSPFYAGIIDGSERAGVAADNRAALWLFDKYNFIRDRESIIMQVDLKKHQITTEDPLVYYQSRQGQQTWLDRVFSSWTLYDHAMLADTGLLLSRAIHARMDGLSDFTGKEIHSIFGVSTPIALRGKGLATKNIVLLLSRLKESGADTAELHVYADNRPAINLYERCGFHEIGRTFSLRRR